MFDAWRLLVFTYPLSTIRYHFRGTHSLFAIGSSSLCSGGARHRITAGAGHRRNPQTGLRTHAPLSDFDRSPTCLRRNGTGRKEIKETPVLVISVHIVPCAAGKSKMQRCPQAALLTVGKSAGCGYCLYPRLSHVFPFHGKHPKARNAPLFKTSFHPAKRG